MPPIFCIEDVHPLHGWILITRIQGFDLVGVARFGQDHKSFLNDPSQGS